jgi:predicted ribosome quality control (RQC) complex YloA/Tae2 family protein
LKDIEGLIINEFLNPDNVTHFYLDAITFENEKIIKACETIIQAHIQRILADTAETEFLMKLPQKRIVSLFKANGLNTKDELELMKFIEKYLKFRDHLPTLVEDDPVKTFRANLKDFVSPEEIKRMEDEETKKKEEEKKVHEEEEKKLEEELKAMNDQDGHNEEKARKNKK